MEKLKAICAKCGGPVEASATGRPPSYCSVGCRRAAEYEIRRISRRLERLEDQLADQRGSRTTVLDWHGRTPAERRAALEGEIADGEARLRLLLDATAEG